MNRAIAGRAWVAILVTAVSATLTACGAVVPTTGPVVYHTPNQARVGSQVRVAPLPPSAGASPSLIVEGFLHAMSVYQPGYGVAREYLTPEASRAWNPDAGVQIYSDGHPVTVVDDAVRLSAPQVGALDGRGEYRAANGPFVQQDFGLVRDAQGEWRISTPPDGLLISRYLFSSEYINVNLHYPDANGAVLVPEPVWLPGGDGALLRVAQRQLGGPGEWLAPVARALPDVVAVDATVSQGTAVVTLESRTATPSATDRGQLLAALAYTLTQLAGVVRVEVVVAGVPWTLPGKVSAEFAPSDFPEFAPVRPGPAELYVVSGGEVRQVSPSAASPQPVPVASGVHGATALAVSAKRRTVASLTADGTSVVAAVIDAEEAAPVRTGKKLLRPDYSRPGELWTAEASGAGSFRVYVPGPDGALVAAPLTIAGAPKGKLVAFRLSPDGDRMAVALGGQGGAGVGLFRIARKGDSLTLDGWRPIALPSTLSSAALTSVVDVAWSTATELLVLVGDEDGVTRVTRTTQDAATTADIGPASATGLTELATAPGLHAVARGAGGAAYRFEADFTWTLWMTGVEALAFAS